MYILRLCKTVLRARELMIWVESGEYSRVLYRCSKWLNDEILRLSEKTDRVIQKKTKTQIAARIAQNQHNSAMEVYELGELSEKNAVQNLFAKGKDGIKNVQNKVNENAIRKKQKKAVDSEELFRRVALKEKQLREVYCEVDEEDILQLTNNTIGNLNRVEYDKTAYDLNVEDFSDEVIVDEEINLENIDEED